jgi:predicted RNA polymerase sigma factor
VFRGPTARFWRIILKADLLTRLGRGDEAAGAYRRALELTANEAERAFLTGRLAALGSSGARPE